MIPLGAGSAYPPRKPGNVPRIPLMTTVAVLYIPETKHVLGHRSVYLQLLQSWLGLGNTSSWTTEPMREQPPRAATSSLILPRPHEAPRSPRTLQNAPVIPFPVFLRLTSVHHVASMIAITRRTSACVTCPTLLVASYHGLPFSEVSGP